MASMARNSSPRDGFRSAPGLVGVRCALLALYAAALLAALPAMAQEADSSVHIQPREVKLPAPADPQPGGDVDPSLKTHTKTIIKDVDLVLVNVTITDPMNRLVTGLEKDNFQLLEGSKTEDIRHFSSEDAPISLGVIFDMSGSMSDKLERVRDAAVEFFKTANPQDEFFMITVSDRPEVLSDFTKDRKSVV